MYYLSVDVGARYTKIILFKVNDIIARKRTTTSYNSNHITKNINDLLKDNNILPGQINKIISTGSYREFLELPNIYFSEIKSAAKAINLLHPLVRTIIDIGFESSKIIKIDSVGHIWESISNERCATGAGSFVESMAISLNMPIEEFSNNIPSDDNKISLSSQCVVFAESEAISLIHSGVDRRDIAAAVNASLAAKIASLALRIKPEGQLALIGGLAYNSGFISSLKSSLNTGHIIIPEFPDFIPAYGAFLLYFEGIN